jgi:sarcosine oxidase subunit gamma
VGEFNLKPEPFLGGYERDFGFISIKELNQQAVVSFAIPNGGENKAKKTLKKLFGVSCPKVGESELSKDGSLRLMRLGPDQLFCLISDQQDTHAAYQDIDQKLGQDIYTTDQSDVWVCLEASGPQTLKVMERICPIDLHPDNFKINNLARTTMEHLGTIILRSAKNTYVLLSASSSANSFLHTLETSIKNIQ